MSSTGCGSVPLSVVVILVARTGTGYVAAPRRKGDSRRRLEVHNVVITVVETRARSAAAVAVGTGGDAFVFVMLPLQIGEITVYGGSAVGGFSVAGPAVSVDVGASPLVAGGTRGGE